MPQPLPQSEASGKSLSEETCRSEGGFTLIELMVVLLILAILLAIAIPTFLGVTKSANDRAAQSNLNTAILNSEAQYQKNSQAYPAAATLVTALASAEPSLNFVPGASADQNHISVAVSTDNTGLVLAAFSKPTGTCWVILDVPTTVSLAASNAPWAAAQGPTVAVDTTLPVTTAGNVSFLNTQLGTTYAEIKGVTSTQCNATQPAVTNPSSYRWSLAAFPSI